MALMPNSGSLDESVERRAIQEGDLRSRYGLSIRALPLPGSEGRLPEHLPCLQHADGHFLSSFQAVDAHPPFEEQEEYLAPVSGGEDMLAHLEGLGRDAVDDPLQLLLREQREETDPGKECRIVFIQPENQLSANYTGFLQTPIVSDDTDTSTAIGEDLGALGLRRSVSG
jgi:hypothetical protein